MKKEALTNNENFKSELEQFRQFYTDEMMAQSSRIDRLSRTVFILMSIQLIQNIILVVEALRAIN